MLTVGENPGLIPGPSLTAITCKSANVAIAPPWQRPNGFKWLSSTRKPSLRSLRFKYTGPNATLYPEIRSSGSNPSGASFGFMIQSYLVGYSQRRRIYADATPIPFVEELLRAAGEFRIA